MKVLSITEWRAFSSGCREVVRLQVHKYASIFFFFLFFPRLISAVAEWMFALCRIMYRSMVDIQWMSTILLYMVWL